MSFSVSDGRGGFEWATHGPRALFARPGHALDPRFHRMLLDLARFNRDLRRLIGRRAEGPSLRRFLAEGGYSEYFVERLLVPQASAIWSADPEQMWSFPAAFLAEFFDNHRVLQLRGRPAWRTVSGGSRRYVEALIAPFRERVHLRTPVRHVIRHHDSVTVGLDDADERFDEVVLAVHSDRALRLLADPTRAEAEVLGAIGYQRNEAVLHTRREPAAAPALRAGELELPPRRRARRPHDAHLRHEPAAVTRRGPRSAGHAQPHRGDRSRQGDPHDRLRAPGVLPRGRRGTGPLGATSPG